MGLIGSILGKLKQPSAPNPIRETLFGDMPLENWPSASTAAEEFPWSKFVEARANIADGRAEAAVAYWREILEHPGLEPRHYLQAWNFLRQYGQQPPPETAKLLLGVIVEVAMPEGLDLLAAYSDHSARYYNSSGAGVVWDHPDDSLNSKIDALFTESRQVVANIGPWEGQRPPAPPRGQARLSFLTPGGLCFGQGPMDALSRDALAGDVLNAATILMKALISKTEKS